MCQQFLCQCNPQTRGSSPEHLHNVSATQVPTNLVKIRTPTGSEKADVLILEGYRVGYQN